MKHRFQGKGFTLIELLVVIAIIAILSAIGLYYLGYTREKARDSRRQHDLANVRTALALYFDDENGYPDGTSTCATTTGGSPCTWSGSLPVLETAGNPPYIGQLPDAPNAGGTDPQTYTYTSSPSDQHFLLYTQFETQGNKWYYLNDKGVIDTVATIPNSGVCDDTNCP